MTAARMNADVAVEWLVLLLPERSLTVSQINDIERELGRLEESLGIEAFVREYESDSEYVRMHSVMKAGKLRDDSRIGFLRMALKDSKSDVRTAAINALGSYYHPQSAGILVNYLYDEATIEHNHEALINAGEVAHSSPVRKLLPALPRANDKDAGKREPQKAEPASAA